MAGRRERLISDLQDVLNNEKYHLTTAERQILSAAYHQLNNNVDVNRCVFELKSQLSELSLTKGLTPELVSYFSELSRREPSTSASAMWNFLVTKKSH